MIERTLRSQSSQAAVHTVDPMGFWAQKALRAFLEKVGEETVKVYKVKELTYTGQLNILVMLGEIQSSSDLTALLFGDVKKGRFGFAVDASTPS